MKKEITVKGQNGFLALLLILGVVATSIYLTVNLNSPIYGIGAVAGLLLMPGLTIVNPNESRVFTLFGKYAGTLRENGFFFVNPFFVKRKVSLRAHNFDSERLKVNDKLGNPILISVILVWRVQDTFKAAFEVDNYAHFVKVQTDAAVRKLAGLYPYDDFDENHHTITLRSGLEEVNNALEQELAERLAMAGITVMEARIGYLAYAEEIAQAMLKRQQATAVVSARFKIVEGAVGMVEMALAELEKKGTIHMDEERKAAMVSNLLVVLCGDKEASPVVNTGTLHN